EELLGNVAAPQVEARLGSLELKNEAAGPGEQHADVYQAVQDLQRRFGLTHQSVQPNDQNLIRTDGERQLGRQVVDRYRALPPVERQKLPALLNAVGQLELAAGDLVTAVRDFQAAADILRDSAGAGEAHMNAHRAALLLGDNATAINEFLQAVRLDGRRF